MHRGSVCVCVQGDMHGLGMCVCMRAQKGVLCRRGVHVHKGVCTCSQGVSIGAHALGCIYTHP